MTETINITVDSEDLKEFKETTGMSIGDCIKILVNSVKYGGKLEFDPFWSDENMAELKRRIKSGKMEKHDLSMAGILILANAGQKDVETYK